jgi:hypothetical protein
VVVNRSQTLVIAFLGGVWMALICILVFAPRIYVATLNVSPSLEAPAELAFFAFVTALIAVLVVGVMRRWRWAFWLIVVAFLAGLLRVPASILEITGTLPASGPTWYVLLQGVIGVSQFAIAVALLIGYRKAGVWGSF